MLAMEQVAAVLAQAGLGVVAKTIFVHRMPNSVNAGLLVLPSLTGADIDYDMPSFRREQFQVIARGVAPPAVQALAVAASEALTIQRGWTTISAVGIIPAANILFIRPRHTPIVFPRSDAGDLYEASVNFDYICVA